MIFDQLKNIKFFLPEEISNLFNNFPNLGLNQKFSPSNKFFIKNIEYHTKNENECLIESHRKYVDVQLLLEGTEIIKIFDNNKLIKSTEYDIKEDVIFYQMNYNPFIQLKFEPGYFCILFPEDAHLTAIKVDDVAKITKIVIKVDISMFNRKI